MTSGPLPISLPATASQLAAMDCRALHGQKALGLDIILAQVNEMAGWQYLNGKICRRFGFKDYAQTLDFVNRVAALADAQDHHPLIEFGYSHAQIWLDTHDCGGISVKDFILAAKISQLV